MCPEGPEPEHRKRAQGQRGARGAGRHRGRRRPGCEGIPEGCGGPPKTGCAQLCSRAFRDSRAVHLQRGVFTHGHTNLREAAEETPAAAPLPGCPTQACSPSGPRLGSRRGERKPWVQEASRARSRGLERRPQKAPPPSPGRGIKGSLRMRPGAGPIQAVGVACVGPRLRGPLATGSPGYGLTVRVSKRFPGSARRGGRGGTQQTGVARSGSGH